MTRLLLATALLGLTSCQALRHTVPAGAVEHIVLAWQKKPGDAADRARLIAVTKELKAKIPELKHLSVGSVLPSERPVVDDSFDIAFVMRFASQADLKTYEQHPLHTQLVKDVIKPLTAKIVVHDFVTE
jgi:hypothetical protein